MIFHFRLCALVVVLTSAPLLVADETAPRLLVRNLQGQVFEGELIDWSESAVTLGDDSAATSLDVQALRRVDFLGQSTRLPEPGLTLWIQFINGDVALARGVTIRDENVRATGGILARETLGLGTIWSLDVLPELRAPPEVNEDVLVLANGDRASGQFLELEENAVRLDTVLGPATFQLEQLRRIVFNAQLQDRVSIDTPIRYRICLHDGSILTASRIVQEPGGLRCQLVMGPEILLSLRQLAAVGIEGRQVASLTRLTPIETTQETFFGASFPVRINRAWGGRQLLVRGRKYASGFGVRSQSTLTFSVPASASAFLADVGLDDTETEKGAAIAQVVVDGAVRWEAEIQAGATAESVGPVDVSSCRNLSLVIKFGPQADVSDAVNWCAPVFVLSAP